jgi:outer membrane protein assembly factor BamB
MRVSTLVTAFVLVTGCERVAPPVPSAAPPASAPESADAGTPPTADGTPAIQGPPGGVPIGNPGCPGTISRVFSFRPSASGTANWIERVGPSTGDGLLGVEISTVDANGWRIDLALLDADGHESAPRIPLWKPSPLYLDRLYDLAVEGGKAIVSSWDGLRAFNLTDGSLSWVWNDAELAEYASNGGSLQATRVATGATAVYVARNKAAAFTEAGLLIAADLQTGRTLWQEVFPGQIWDLLVDENGNVHVGYTGAPRTYLSLTPGGRERFRLPAEGLGSWAVSSGVVYRESRQLVHSADGSNGAVLPTDTSFWPVAIGPHAIFYTPSRSVSDLAPLIAVDLASGTQLWTAPFYPGDQAFAVSSATGEAGVLYTDQEYRIHAVTEDGHEQLTCADPQGAGNLVAVLPGGKIVTWDLVSSSPVEVWQLPLALRPADRGWTGAGGSPGFGKHPSWK